MKDDANRRSRTIWRLGATAVLLSMTLVSAAQTSLRWNSPNTNASVPPRTAAGAYPVQVPGSLSATPYRAATEQPLPAGFDVRLFEAMAQQLVANQRIPGLAMAIVHDGRVLSARGYGVTDVNAAEPVDAHTVFRLASLSKAFAGTMAGLLVNDGTLRWDSKLTQYMPNFQLSDPNAARQVTVADLLSHRVGLPHNTYDRDLEKYVDYRTLTQRLSSTPLQCAPGTCYSYQNIAFSLIGDIVFAATGDFYSQEVQRRLFKPLGMNDASIGLDGIEGSSRWARPHVRRGAGWMSVMPKPTYYQVAPAAGVNASASDMAQWLLAHTGHRPDVLPAPLLATLHQPLVDTPSETRGSAWRRERVGSAGYALGWRVYDYAGNRLVFHGGAVQGYRGVVARLPGRDLGVAMMWNSESALPSGLLPTILDRAIGIQSQPLLDVDFDDPTLYAQLRGTSPAPASHTDDESVDQPGSSPSTATAAPF